MNVKLKFSVLFLAIFFISIQIVIAQQKPNNIGIQLWSVRDLMKTDPKGTIEQIGKMGFKYVEAAGYSNGKFYDLDPFYFKALCNKNGLDFVSSHVGEPAPDSLNDIATLNWWNECIDAHARAGVKYIIQASMDESAYKSIDRLKKYCEYFNMVGAMCKSRNIQFGYHNHDKEFGELNGTTIYDFMLNNTDSKKLVFQIDLYWIFYAGKDVMQYFNSYPGRFELYHIKDEAELGASGKMNFKPYFDSSVKAGMKYYFIEVEKYNYPVIESIRKSFEYLSSIIK